MATATILSIQNALSNDASVQVFERGSCVYECSVPANSFKEINPVQVPAAQASTEYPDFHVEVMVQGLAAYHFWQYGNKIYYCHDGCWNCDQEMVFEDAATPGAQDIHLNVASQDGDTWVTGQITESGV